MATDKAKLAAAVKAFPLSFLVYLIPVPIAHWLTIWGDKLWTEIESGGDYRDPEWFALDLTLAVVLQLAAWLLWFWFFQQPKLTRFAAVQAAVPLFWLTINQVYEKVFQDIFLLRRTQRSRNRAGRKSAPPRIWCFCTPVSRPAGRLSGRGSCG